MLDLDEATQRIHDLSGEVDNVYTDVRYRAPMAELAHLARTLVAELRVAQEALRVAPRPPNFRTNTKAYVDALAAYDKVTGGDA